MQVQSYKKNENIPKLYPENSILRPSVRVRPPIRAWTYSSTSTNVLKYGHGRTMMRTQPYCDADTDSLQMIYELHGKALCLK